MNSRTPPVRSVLDDEVEPVSRRPHRHDLLIAAVGLLGGLLLWLLGLRMQNGRLFEASWTGLVPLVPMAVAESMRRTRPGAALATATVLLAADQLTPGNIATVLMYTDVVYAAVVYGSEAAARRIPVISLLGSVALTLGLLPRLRPADAVLVGVLAGLVTFVPAVTGAGARGHRVAAEAARLRAEQTALLAEADRSQAVAEERSRMARELHDVVAGHLSAIALHSTAALSIDDPATSREALAVIRENSVAGLAEMRRLIGLLRRGGAPELPGAAPRLSALDALIEQSRGHAASSGLSCVLDDARDGGALPAPVELAAYRIVQESLTNALKHAAPGTVRVRLARPGALLTVEVTSVFGVRPGPRTPPGSGAGLIGMRERAELLGGTIRAGEERAADGSAVWRVRAELPVPEGTERGR
ncbi:sensor histidine kinase [Streptomyces sp. NBC_00101]|uniref:sensor histidine kinase n=1 Tax=Streptomyces sp. NBC_00101 TaxID=2975651 RepID=UPI00386E7132